MGQIASFKILPSRRLSCQRQLQIQVNENKKKDERRRISVGKRL